MITSSMTYLKTNFVFVPEKYTFVKLRDTDIDVKQRVTCSSNVSLWYIHKNDDIYSLILLYKSFCVSLVYNIQKCTSNYELFLFVNKELR